MTAMSPPHRRSHTYRTNGSGRNMSNLCLLGAAPATASPILGVSPASSLNDLAELRASSGICSHVYLITSSWREARGRLSYLDLAQFSRLFRARCRWRTAGLIECTRSGTLHRRSSNSRSSSRRHLGPLIDLSPEIPALRDPSSSALCIPDKPFTGRSPGCQHRPNDAPELHRLCAGHASQNNESRSFSRSSCRT